MIFQCLILWVRTSLIIALINSSLSGYLRALCMYSISATVDVIEMESSAMLSLDVQLKALRRLDAHFCSLLSTHS